MASCVSNRRGPLLGRLQRVQVTYYPLVKYLYYKMVDPNLCSAKAPVLEGSGSRRLYPLKGKSVDRV